MERCQHNQKLTKFCASQCCVWKEAAGCLNCMKKYHNHIGPSTFIDEKDIENLLKKYKTQYPNKSMIKDLEEAIYSYFNHLKHQMDEFLDQLNKRVRTQICYPYLNKHGLVSVYKKLKKKEYKKVIQKQFRTFIELSNKIQGDEIMYEEKKLSQQSLLKNSSLIFQCIKDFRILESSFQMFQNPFKIQKAYENKIIELLKKINIHNNQQFPKRNNTQAKQYCSIINKNQDLLHQLDLQRSKEYSMFRTKSDHQKQKKQHINKSKEIQNWKYEQKQGQLTSIKSKLLHLMKTEEDECSKIKFEHQQSLEASTIDYENPLLQKKKNIFQRKLSNLATIKGQKNRLYDNSIEKNYFQYDKVKGVTNYQQEKKFPIHNLDDEINKNKLLKDSRFKLQKQIKNGQIMRQDPFKNLLTQSLKRQNKNDIVPLKQQFFTEINEQQYLSIKKKNKTDIEKQQQVLKKSGKKQNKKQESIINFKQSPKKILLKQNQQKSILLLIESRNKKPEDAIPLLYKSLEFSPNNLSAAEFLTFILLQLQKPNECLKVCNKVLQQLQDNNKLSYDVNSVHLYNNKAVCLILLGRYSQSIPILQNCISIKQTDRFYKNLGDAYYSLGIYKKAIQNYEKSLNLNNNSAQTYFNLAIVYFTLQDYQKSLSSIQKAKKLDPNRSNYIQLSSQIQMRL